MKKILVLLIALLPTFSYAQETDKPDQSDSNPFVKRTTTEAVVSTSLLAAARLDGRTGESAIPAGNAGSAAVGGARCPAQRARPA